MHGRPCATLTTEAIGPPARWYPARHMRHPRSRSAARWTAAALATAWLTAGASSFASAATEPRSLPGGTALGMTVPELQAQTALKRVPHPARLAGGLVGSWSAGPIDVAGVALTPTFYFADGHLERVEYLARDGGPVAFPALLAWARQSWGAELAAADPEGAYASWATDDMDVYLQQAGTAQGAQVRLVIRHRVLKDASEL